jgi:hypothetical protein
MVVRNVDVDILVPRKLSDVYFAGASQKRVEFGGDVLEPEIYSRGSLVDNTLDLAAGQLCRNSIPFNGDVNGGVFVISGRCGDVFLFGDVDASTGSLADVLDGLTLPTNDVGAD